MAETPQDGFEGLLERHRKIVFKVANTYCRNAEDRRDLGQEIAVHMWRAFPAYDEARPFSTWMYRVALNVAISFARRAGYRDAHSVPPAQYARELEAVWYRGCLARRLRHFRQTAGDD